MKKLPGFPDFSALATRARITDLVRLAEPDITRNEYVYGKGIARLLAAMLDDYVVNSASQLWSGDRFIARAIAEDRLFSLFLAAAFDLATNIEYAHGRLANSRWIYCDRDDAPHPSAYYSFLKQCPRCCLDKGLENRLAGAQHKPSSHHIGEITTTVIALLLRLIASGNKSCLSIATITKQSHDVDAIGYCADLITLFEIKASPMATLPFSCDLSGPLVKTDEDGEVVPYRQHQLVDIIPDMTKIGLFLPHRSVTIPLPLQPGDIHWPYEAAERTLAQPAWITTYFSAWLELFYAYSIPKTARTPSEQILTYLVNGWGDEIDSNKTKPGLGRTDDIKKGTYQLLKFGAYYNDENADLKVRGLLVGNLDALFLKPAYFDGLKDVRWGQEYNFVADGSHFRVEQRHLHYLYNAVVAFNESVINDPALMTSFDFKVAERALLDGSLHDVLTDWRRGDLDID